MSTRYAVAAATVIRVPGPTTPPHTVVVVVEETAPDGSTRRSVGTLAETGEGEAASAPDIGTPLRPADDQPGPAPAWVVCVPVRE